MLIIFIAYSTKTCSIFVIINFKKSPLSIFKVVIRSKYSSLRFFATCQKLNSKAIIFWNPTSYLVEVGFYVGFWEVGFLKNPLLLNKKWDFYMGFQKWDFHRKLWPKFGEMDFTPNVFCR